VSFAAITLCVSSQRVFVVDFVMNQSGNFWLHPRTLEADILKTSKHDPLQSHRINVCSLLNIFYVFSVYKLSSFNIKESNIINYFNRIILSVICTKCLILTDNRRHDRLSVCSTRNSIDLFR
jgi:hypothetical protein